MEKRKVGEIQVELIFSQPPGNATGAAIVPPDALADLEAKRTHFEHKTIWFYASDPLTGEKRPAFTPIQGGSLRLIQGAGINHGERFLATYHVNEVDRDTGTRREMWLVKAESLRS